LIASALARIDPGLLAKIDPLPCSSVALSDVRQGCKIASFVGFGARQTMPERALRPESMTLRTKEEFATPSAWMMLDLVLALRQVVFLVWVNFRERK
jgi:hypothetical protein